MGFQSGTLVNHWYTIEKCWPIIGDCFITVDHGLGFAVFDDDIHYYSLITNN